MSNRISRNVPLLLTGVGLLVLTATSPATAQQPVPWPCTGEAFVVQDVDATLYRVDQSVTPFVLDVLCPNLGMEINNLGFCRTDGLLYAVQLNPNGNDQLIQIDANCNIFPLGTPSGDWDYGPRFDAGELSLDGSKMYVTWGFYTNEELYTVSMTDWQASSVTCTGADGCVHDWAVHPFTGDLYGCDNTDGQLAKIDLALGQRIDYPVPGLDPGDAFGGAWFNSAGRLFCYRNSGTIYEIDLVTKTIVRTQSGPASTRNDATACVPIGDECGDCEGKVTTLTLKYLGTVPEAWIEVVGIKSTTAFQGTVQPGGTFVVDADIQAGTLGPELDLYVDGVFNTIIHTSCSQPIYILQIWGDFQILEGASKVGGPLCAA